MNIFYINVIENNAGWGAEYFVNQGFLDSGHETQTLDYRKFRESLASKFLEISDFDVFLLQRGEGFPLELIEACQRPRFFGQASWCRDAAIRIGFSSADCLIMLSFVRRNVFHRS